MVVRAFLCNCKDLLGVGKVYSGWLLGTLLHFKSMV